MAIHLKWSNQNAPGNTLNIYRRVGTTITPETKGTAIGSVDSASTSYIDVTAVSGETYSYLLEVVAPLGVAYSRPTSTVNLRRIGPGGVEILYGDSEFGYMGTVPIYQMPNYWDAIDFPDANVAPYNSNLVWHKFVRKGKILIVPSIPATKTWVGDYDTWLNGIWVYSTYGLASGLTWNFDTSDPKYAPYKRTWQITFGEDKFNIRAPRAYPDNWDGVFSTAKSLDPTTEVNQVIQSMYQGCYIGNNVGNVQPLITNQYFGAFICAEGIPNGTVTAQSTTLLAAHPGRIDNFVVLSDWLAGVPINSGSDKLYEKVNSKWRHGNAASFHPVFELIGE